MEAVEGIYRLKNEGSLFHVLDHIKVDIKK